MVRRSNLSYLVVCLTVLFAQNFVLTQTAEAAHNKFCFTGIGLPGSPMIQLHPNVCVKCNYGYAPSGTFYTTCYVGKLTDCWKFTSSMAPDGTSDSDFGPAGFESLNCLGLNVTSQN